MSSFDDRETCYRILLDCFENNTFSNLALKEKNVSDFVRAAVYGTLTYLEGIDFLVRIASGKNVSDMDIEARTIVRFGAWQILFSDKVPDYAAVSSSVELCKKHAKFSAGFVNHVLRSVSDMTPEERDINNYKPEVATCLKSEIYGIFKKNYGKERALSIGKAFLNTPKLTIRVNTMKTDKMSLAKTLADEGIKTSDAVFIEDALVIDSIGDTPLDKVKAFTDGLFFVQGESAMLASLVANPAKGMKILDCCSAPGGKSTHMAELCEDDCSILSLDINESRLELIKQNTSRLGLNSISTRACDSTVLSTELEGVGTYDMVTADVPCSGLGLLARKPDIRYLITYDRIQELLPKQYQILCEASKMVKPGGILIYSTCTVNRAENEAQVERFLSEHDDFYAEDISELLPAGLIIESDREESVKNGMITLLPDSDGCDGFFISRLKRKV